MCNIYERSNKGRRFKLYFFTLIILISITSICRAEIVSVSDFNGSVDLTGWKEKEFSGKTEYKEQKIDGKWALAARSSSSASGLVKKIKIDLKKNSIY